MTLRAPFPYAGGKSKVAHLVWAALGKPRVYVEPFFGSGAVLLSRPSAPEIETVNDVDGLLVHFWRALRTAPAEVARHADYPVSELCLHARHRELVRRAAEVKARLEEDPRWCDPEIAGWWVNGLSQWIGGGWCAQPRSEQATRPAISHADHGVHARGAAEFPQRPHVSASSAGMGVHAVHTSERKPQTHGAHEGRGVHRKRPVVASDNEGRGVHRKRPAMGGNSDSRGVHGVPQRRPNLTTAGTGVQRQMPAAHGLGGAGVHAHGLASDSTKHTDEPELDEYQAAGEAAARAISGVRFRDWFEALATRLRSVRIVSGDFERVLTKSTLYTEGSRVAGVFLDPPYSHEMRSTKLYAHDTADVAERARKWAIEHGDNPRLRIVLAGLEGEHDMPASWRKVAWKGPAGLGRVSGNRHLERLWLSPHCLQESKQASLFSESP